MNPILFYGVPSGCSFGSIVALEWLGEPYQLCRIEMPGEVSSDAYKQINPVAETPSLMTGSGAVISESMAILNHIAWCGRDHGLGFAQGSPQFDRLNEMLGFLNTTFFSAFSPLWYAFEHGDESGQLRALKDYGAGSVLKAHAQLDAMLAGRRWLLGNQRTVADAYFIGIARWTEYHDVLDRRSYANVQRLFEALEEDAAVVFAHAVERQEPAQSAGGFVGDIGLPEALKRLHQAA